MVTAPLKKARKAAKSSPMDNLVGLDRAIALIEESILEKDSDTAATKLCGLSTTKIREAVEKCPDLIIPLAELRLKWIKDVEKIATQNGDGNLLFKLVQRLDKAEQAEKQERASLVANVQMNTFLEQFQSDARALAKGEVYAAESERALDAARSAGR